MAGVAGFEPATYGFGDRCSTVELHAYANGQRSVGNECQAIVAPTIGNWQLTIGQLLGLAVRGVGAAPGAIFLELQPRLVVAAVLFAGVVALFALSTR